MTDPIPLTHIELETAIPAEQLAARHADLVVEDRVGRLCLPTAIAREIIAGHREAQVRIAADHQARHARAADAHRKRIDVTRRRLHARRPPSDPTMSALQNMMGADAERRLDAVGRRHQEMARGISSGARYTQEKA